MFTKIILIQVDSILVYPPTVSLIHELDKTGCKVTVLTTVVNDQLRKVLPESVSLQKIGSGKKKLKNYLRYGKTYGNI